MNAEQTLERIAALRRERTRAFWDLEEKKKGLKRSDAYRDVQAAKAVYNNIAKDIEHLLMIVSETYRQR